ncbi:MAG: hypothetical protein WEC59_04505 [Salibacteraceae bacterium]
MPRQKRFNKNKNEKPPADSNKDKVENVEQDSSMYIPFLKNVIGLIALFFLSYYLINNIRGYKWLSSRFLESNIEKMEKLEHLTTSEKYQAYFRFNHKFLEHINQNTPDSAIIYMPPDSVIMPESGKKTDFYTKKKSNSILNKVWATYFVYPRKLVYHDEREEIPAFDRYNYVACVNGWGYEHLEYRVSEKQKAQYQILPRTLETLKRINKKGSGQ